MTNLPPGAANDPRAPFNETEMKPTLVDVIVYKAAVQINGCVNNFVVHIVDHEPGTPSGWGRTLQEALEDFEDSYINRHEEYCQPIIKETIIQY